MTDEETDRIVFSMDKALLDLDLIIQYLHDESYWASSRPEHLIRKSIEHSLCFGAYLNDRQIGFGRAVTDQAVFYYLADIFILPPYQGKGIGHRFMEYILNCDDLKFLRGVLTTQTAHSFYEKFGFSQDNEIARKRIMVRREGAEEFRSE